MQDSKQVFQAMFKDDSLTVGGNIKAKGEVLKEFFKARSKPPNLNCRVESFARICQTFDSRRRRWVAEMGFGGLLYLSGDMHLPRQLGYWLVTRLDPISKMLLTPDGRCLRLSKNQVHWVLGIPNGPKILPSCKTLKGVQREKVKNSIAKYGTTRNKGQSTVYDKVGIPVYPELLERLEGHWEENEEEEFKTLFLLISLEMLLCPTLSTRLSSDLLPALTCAMEAVDYDWCTLVLSKLLSSVRSFARRFYSYGHAGGCGGCILFVLTYYLDRLDREAVQWGVFPRLKVWSMKEILSASKEDRSPNGGDYGCKGTLDVAYGEIHPRQARDTDGPGVVTNVAIEHDIDFTLAPRRRRGLSSKIPGQDGEKTYGPENVSVAVDSEGPNRKLDKIAGCSASLPHVGYVDDWRRFLPTGALSLLRKMISCVMRASNYFMMGDWQLILSAAFLQVVSFDGHSDYNTVLLPSLCTFISNPRCSVLLVVSEDRGINLSSDLAMCRICIAVKKNSGSEMMLLSADSITSEISSISRPMLNTHQVYHDIFVSCMKGLTTSKLSRNVLLVQSSRA